MAKKFIKKKDLQKKYDDLLIEYSQIRRDFRILLKVGKDSVSYKSIVKHYTEEFNKGMQFYCGLSQSIISEREMYWANGGRSFVKNIYPPYEKVVSYSVIENYVNAIKENK